MKRKRNKKVWDALKTPHKDYLIQAGWFEQSKYDNSMPIGGIAAVQNYGAAIHNPGGQPFFKNKKGEVIYASKNSPHAKRMAKTKPHTIVIPPSHFWEAAQEENKVKWRQAFNEAWQSVFLGNITPDKAMERIALMIEGDIAKAIQAVDSPPLAESTIHARQNRMSDKKTTGKLTKRLVDTGQMFDSLSHKVTKF